MDDQEDKVDMLELDCIPEDRHPAEQGTVKLRVPRTADLRKHISVFKLTWPHTQVFKKHKNDNL